MDKIKNIFFDFDGVIAESVSSKTEAFREMYLPYGNEIANQVVDYHIKNGGVSRFEKFRYWEKFFFNKEVSENRLNELTNKFSDLVLDKVINSKFVLGLEDFLDKYNERLNFWIITGTPTNEIEIIVKKKGIINYFKGIHGSPESKKYWTELLINKNNLQRGETLFLGDATTDLEAARFSKLYFALRDNDENKNLFKNYKGERFTNFIEFERKFSAHFI